MPDPQRRAGDRPWKARLRIFVRENAYRDVWLLIITAAVFFSILSLSAAVDDLEDTNQRVREGRSFTVNVTCASISAVIDAGRATITGQNGTVSGEFARNLERLGYPPKNVRKRQQRIAARKYAEFIARRVEEATGAKGVVRRNGTLNCGRLLKLGRAGT